MTEPEAAWLGAAIEGEGGLGRLPGKRMALSLEVANTDPEFISALIRITGLADVYGKIFKNPQGRPWAPAFRWRVSRANDMLAIARRCAIYSTKCQRVLALMEDS